MKQFSIIIASRFQIFYHLNMAIKWHFALKVCHLKNIFDHMLSQNSSSHPLRAYHTSRLFSPPAVPSLQRAPRSSSPALPHLPSGLWSSPKQHQHCLFPRLPGAKHCARLATGTQILYEYMNAVDLLVLNSFLSSVLYSLSHFCN